MKYKDFKKNSYGLEAKEVPPKPKTFEDVKTYIKKERKKWVDIEQQQENF